MAIDWLAEAAAIEEELKAVRAEIHRDPELANNEFRTAERIENYLHTCGIETQRVLDTAVVGRLKGDAPGRTVCLRADMDALPVTEDTGAEFSSCNPGIMHACGHDVHMTAALGAAKLLSDHREELKGEVRFLFEPAEEANGGAMRMIAAGCLEGADAVFGAHVDPDLPAGTVGVRYGKFYAASDMYFIEVIGKTVHGATPEIGIDALQAAAEIAIRLKDIPEEFTDKCVVTTGTLNAGTKENTVAGRAEMTGIMRTLGAEMREAVKARLLEICRDVEEKTGAKVMVRIQDSYGGVVNTDEETAVAERAAIKLLGSDKVVRIEKPRMTSEDFGYFVDATSGSFYHIGAGCTESLHSPKFLPDERVLAVGAATHAAVLTTYLEENH